MAHHKRRSSSMSVLESGQLAAAIEDMQLLVQEEEALMVRFSLEVRDLRYS